MYRATLMAAILSLLASACAQTPSAETEPAADPEPAGRLILLPSDATLPGFFWEQRGPDDEFRSWSETRGQIELRPGGKLSYFDWGELSDENVEALAELGPFDSLYLHWCERLTEAGLRKLVSQTTTREIVIAGPSCTAVALALLADWSGLEYLDFGFGKRAVIDADFAPLSRMRQMKRLCVSAGCGGLVELPPESTEDRPIGGTLFRMENALDGRFLSHLPGGLEHLSVHQWLDGAPGPDSWPTEWLLRDDWLSHLPSLPLLRSVEIRGARIGPRVDLSPLLRCPKLRVLSFSACSLPADLSRLGSQLRSLPAVRELHFPDVCMPDTGAAELIHGLRLERLGLFGATGLRGLLAELPRVAPYLQEIQLSYSSCTDEDLLTLTQLPQLRFLSLSGAWDCTSQGVTMFRAIRPDVVVEFEPR